MGSAIVDITHDVLIRNKLPTVFLILIVQNLALLFTAPHWFHAISIQRFRFSEIPYRKLVICVPFHISDAEVKPLLVASSICVDVHKEMVFLRYFGPILEHFLNVAALKITVNKESVGLHDVYLLLFEIFPILLVAFDVFECIRIQSFLRKYTICEVCSSFSFDMGHKTTSNNCLNMIAHLNNVCRTKSLINQVDFFADSFCTLFAVTYLQDSHVSRDGLGIKEAAKSCYFISAD